MSKEFELLNTFERSDSCCSPSSQKKLLYAFEERNLDKFVNILKSGVRSDRIDVNHFYEDPENGTLLDIACRSKNNNRFVETLLKYGAEVNTVNSITKKAPLHAAVEKSDTETLKILVENTSININVQDSFGNSALHLAAKQSKADFTQILLKHPIVDVNIQNRKGLTPLHLALNQGNREIVELLLNRLDIDLDESESLPGKTCREIIKEKYPDMELPEINRSTESSKNLFSLLHKRDFKRFAPLAKVNRYCLNDNDGNCTYLQYACEYGLTPVVELLLNLGVDPNGFCPVNTEAPVMIAAKYGYHNILLRLLRNSEVSFKPSQNKTVLHSLFEGTHFYDDVSDIGDEECNHLKCLEYLLTEVPRDQLDINYVDDVGRSVLHYAVKLNNDKVVTLLLRAGAYVGQKDLLGETPLSSISAPVFEQYLNECISTNGKPSRDENYEIIYNCTFLVPPKIVESPDKVHLTLETARANAYDVISETEPLLQMSNLPELRKLLKHPVLTTYLNLKWYTIRKYFYVNLAFYLAFWFALTSYILYLYGSSDSKDLAKNNTESIQNLDFPRNGTMLWCVTILLTAVLLFRELFQFGVHPGSYLKSPENWLELSLIFLSGCVLICQTSLDLQPQVAAVAILASWMELILLIGRHPLLSTNIEMFKTVTYNFLKFLAWYSILILAFAFSFYILFKDSAEENNVFFRNPLMSVFKSVIMLTGEFDAGSIPFGAKLSTSHLLFILFVFLIAIVLFNLLNGLAVSDTQAIRSDAEIVGNVSRVKLISYIETMAIGDPFPCSNFFDKLSCACCCLPVPKHKTYKKRNFELLYKKINLFPGSFSDGKIHVLPNQGNLVVFDSDTDRRKDLKWRIDPNIIKASKIFLCEREKGGFADELAKNYSQQFQQLQTKLQSVEDKAKRNEQMLEEIRTILKEKL